MKIQVKVTQEYIDRGERCNPLKCAIALAIQEALLLLGITETVSCSRYSIVIGSKSIRTPNTASIAIDTFDDGQRVQPIEFELEVP